MKQNLPDSLKADKRFEALVKQEMMEHQHIISSHHKEMQALRDDLKYARERFDALYDRSQKEHKEHADALNEILEVMRSQLKQSQVDCAECRQTISDLNKEIQDIRNNYTTQVQTESLRKYADIQFNLYNASYVDKFQKHQQEMKKTIGSLIDDILKINEQDARYEVQVEAKIEDKFSLCKMDKEGVLKELRACKKDVFISEKKIEHLYMQIDKLNKKGEVCHKQV